jgi:23S rRNA (cytidine1920-2'-O)/16S rRNA (cytidine1409-2'-O)-methyltransferase
MGETPRRPPRPTKARLDELVVARGLADSRTKAQALILAGRVLVDDRPADKPGLRVAPDAALRLRGETRRYVSRGGEKLAGALADLGVEIAGRRCLDVGASTGGFTDCLLRHGAAHVIALDVGYGQLDLRLRGDPRVRVVERVNAREMSAEHVPPEPAVELVVVDVSFISATLVLPRVAALAPEADVLVMVKPQFEVGRERVGKGGVVRDDVARADAVERVREAAAALGYAARGEAESRLPGPAGNREVFLWLRGRPRVGANLARSMGESSSCR